MSHQPDNGQRLEAGNVVLTGFMGTGKSNVGRLLADRLGLEWVDTDDLIEARHGPIPEMFVEHGEVHFRTLERKLALELGERRGLVISTGGRLMLDPHSARALGAHARVFCLVAAPAEIAHRIAGEPSQPRPLLAGPNLQERIAALLAERAAGYSQFEQVTTDGISVGAVVDILADRLGGDLPS